jgi:predicted nucleotidyltransferase
MPLQRHTVLQQLKTLQPSFQARYPLAHLWLFGSVARDEAHPASDLDLLYEATEPMGLELMSLWDELEALFQCKVDLGDRRYVRPALKPFVEADLIDVF